MRLQVQIKPGAGRLQLDLPLAQAGPNVDANAAPSMQMQQLRLVSSPIALPTSFAVGAATRQPSRDCAVCRSAQRCYCEIAHILVHMA